jgi:hypothetical protein
VRLHSHPKRRPYNANQLLNRAASTDEGGADEARGVLVLSFADEDDRDVTVLLHLTGALDAAEADCGGRPRNVPDAKVHETAGATPSASCRHDQFTGTS